MEHISDRASVKRDPGATYGCSSPPLPRTARTLSLERDLRFRIAFLPSTYYRGCVKTVTIKLEPEQVRWLEQQAEQRQRNRSEIMRELIDQRRSKTAGRSLLARAQDLCGAWPGPKDLSTRSLKGYGQD